MFLIFYCRLPYENLVGGVFSLRTEHFRQLNGYSNSYWGWGAEDDDMSVRYSSSVTLHQNSSFVTEAVLVRGHNMFL